jgi:hypothetical protein
MKSILIAMLATIGASAHSSIVTFDSLESPGTSFRSLGQNWDTNGYRFTAVDPDSLPYFLTTYEQSSAFYRNSAALTSSNSTDILLSRVNGGTFTVTTVDLNFLFGAEPLFEFTGAKLDGTVVQQQFVGNYSAGTQTVALIGFVNITNLRLGGIGTPNFANLGSVDNIAASFEVSEPATIPLLISAMSTLLLLRTRTVDNRAKRSQPTVAA